MADPLAQVAETLAPVIEAHSDCGTRGDGLFSEGRVRVCTCGWTETYAGDTDHGRARWVRHFAQAQADMLAAKGLVASEVEFCAIVGSARCIAPESDARKYAEGGWRVETHSVTPWRAADEGGE